jgi:rod shape-determining protein MreB
MHRVANSLHEGQIRMFISCRAGLDVAAARAVAEVFMHIRGRDLLNGVPKETEISQAQVAEALAEPVQSICEAVMTALEATPPDLAADIVDRGVMLTGGGALLGQLDLALREQTGLAISVADESLNCVALGTGRALEYEKQLRHVIDYDS